MIRLVVGLFLIATPVVELAVLIKLSHWLGVWATIALIVTTAFTGILIISRQSFALVRQTLEAVSEGRPPVAEVLDGVLLMAAGVLLVTPGLITDVMALLLLVPPVRHVIGRWTVHRLIRAARLAGDEAEDMPHEGFDGRHKAKSRNGPVIDGEFERLGEKSMAAPRSNRAGAR